MKYDINTLNKIFKNRTHMPFIMSGENKLLFCQFIDNRWKLSYWDGVNEPQRINTHINIPDTYECSPACVKIGDNYHISYITAGPVPGVDHYSTVLRMCCTQNLNDLVNTQVAQIGAQTGFIYPNKVMVYSYKDCYFKVFDYKMNTEREYMLVLDGGSVATNKYSIARITYINDDCNALLISIVRYSDRYCKTVYFNLNTNEQYCIKTEDRSDVYKCFIDLKENVLYHTLRIGTGHENRKIVVTDKFYYDPVIAFKQIR